MNYFKKLSSFKLASLTLFIILSSRMKWQNLENVPEIWWTLWDERALLVHEASGFSFSGETVTQFTRENGGFFCLLTHQTALMSRHVLEIISCFRQIMLALWEQSLGFFYVFAQLLIPIWIFCSFASIFKHLLLFYCPLFVTHINNLFQNESMIVFLQKDLL